ncbi:carboxypeptidase-like regulatory domain-containing protein [Limibacterium fermenti]|uniref:carboxypeptidase-like regulatory domain-containing protein n=1 Tax=Limibacterium fermenti TaxID=3229863 RepID=UPI000E85F36A|nr:hypothetical protein [Porphyromonadaceae bacterium]
MKSLVIILLFLCSLSIRQVYPENVEQQQDSTFVLRGRVFDIDTRQPLMNASIMVEHSSISSVTNQEGYFTLRVPESAKNTRILIRHLGYHNKTVPLITLINRPDTQIGMSLSTVSLQELLVVSGDGTELVREALRRIPRNYPAGPNMMVAFYRESIKKRSQYISLSEAVLDIYKAPYTSFGDDLAKIYIGRKASDMSVRDTLLLRFQGGINGALLLDIAKNPEIVFGANADDYVFHIENMTPINNKPHYVISFLPRPGIPDILFRGKIYLDAASLAFARMEFNMNVEKRDDAVAIFIKRKPPKMKAQVDHALYVVDFIEDNGKWYFNHSRTEVAFRVRWTNRFFGLFATTYTIGSEIAVTDRYTDDIVKFPRKERIRSTDVIAERVDYFQNPDFWGEYNVIEPDAEITNAISRLSEKLRRRNE